MADGLNRAMVMGRLTADPELRYTAAGQAVLNMRMATNESYTDRNKERKERVDFHNLVLWGPRAEALAKMLSKGTLVYAEGSLRTSSYDDRDGNKRYKTEINVTNVILTGKGTGQGAQDENESQGGGQQQRGGYARGGGGGGYGQQGAAGGYGGGASRQAAPAEQAPPDDFGGDYGGGGDDIPFAPFDERMF